MFAVVITGPPGVEVEALVWTHPALTEEQWRRQIRLNCRPYRDAGHTLLLLAQTLETRAGPGSRPGA